MFALDFSHALIVSITKKICFKGNDKVQWRILVQFISYIFSHIKQNYLEVKIFLCMEDTGLYLTRNDG